MRFDIDSTRAKSMAGRLQVFLTETPKTKLTRSSAIETVAQLLGVTPPLPQGRASG